MDNHWKSTGNRITKYIEQLLLRSQLFVYNLENVNNDQATLSSENEVLEMQIANKTK